MPYDKRYFLKKNRKNMNIVYNMDCIKGMKQYTNKHFELAIIDPPYGIGEDGSKNKSRSKIAKAKNYKPFIGNDIECPKEEYWKELFRVSKNQIIWGANHFISMIPHNSSCWIVWDKDNGETDFADCELAYTSFKSAVRKYKYKWHGMLQGDMKNKEIRIHPTQKPVKLYKWILNNYAKPGDKILDTHLGSGSIRIACYDYGFDFVGYELDKHYFDAQEKRYNNHICQQKLF